MKLKKNLIALILIVLTNFVASSQTFQVQKCDSCLNVSDNIDSLMKCNHQLFSKKIQKWINYSRIGDYYYCKNDSNWVYWYGKFLKTGLKRVNKMHSGIEKKSLEFRLGLAAYRLRSYRDAASWFFKSGDEILESYECGYYYLAVSLINTKRYETARDYFLEYQNRTGNDMSAFVAECEAKMKQ